MPHLHRLRGCLLGISLILAVPFAVAAEKKGAKVQAPPDIASLSERAKKSVVIVRQYGRDGRQDGMGAGFFVSKEGLVATCLHVIGEGRPIRVELADGRRFEVTEIVASDRKLDLALLRIQAGSGLPVLPLGDSGKLKQGESVVAIGNPAGLEHSVVQGVVSGKRDFDGIELIQLAIPIEPGNSGGPLLDLQGRVQGILNMKSAVTANLGFAIPAQFLQSLLDRPNPISIERWLNLGALDPSEWKPVMGSRWSRKAGRIVVENAGDGFGGRSLCLWQKEPPPLPYDVSVMVKLDEESGAAGIAFASDGEDRHYGFYPTAGQMRLTRFDGPNVMSWSILKDFKTPHYKPGDWNDIRVRVEEGRITGFVNGEQVMQSTDTAWRTGRAGLAKFRDTKAQFKNFQIGTRAPTAAPLEPALAAAIQAGTEKSDRELLTHLEPGGDVAREALIQRARHLDLEADRLRRVASGLSERSVQRAMLKELDRPEGEIDLFLAALLVAKLDNPGLDLEVYRAEMARMADELRRTIPSGVNDAGKIDALTRYLFTEQGFHGSRVDFYNRANSHINAVIEDREGLPITLSVVFLELARQIGLARVEGIPVPTRFMVRFQPENGPERLIDVFDRGRVVTRGEAGELVAGNADSLDERDFRPATKREIITRMLHNLLGLAQRQRQPADAIRYLDMILAIDPDSPSDRFHRARAHMQRGDNAAAKEDLRWLIDRAPAGIEVERVRELYQSL